MPVKRSPTILTAADIVKLYAVAKMATNAAAANREAPAPIAPEA
jgi:hypothetical protein